METIRVEKEKREKERRRKRWKENMKERVKDRKRHGNDWKKRGMDGASEIVYTA